MPPERALGQDKRAVACLMMLSLQQHAFIFEGESDSRVL
jgi:hypothetical protein